MYGFIRGLNTVVDTLDDAAGIYSFMFKLISRCGVAAREYDVNDCAPIGDDFVYEVVGDVFE
jgi:hypothetical protein